MATNYGAKLSLLIVATYTEIAEVVKLDFPEIKHPVVEVTAHDSGGYREYIASGLKELTPFKATLNVTDANFDAYSGFLVAGTLKSFEITFNSTMDVWDFDAYVTSVKMLEADAQSPNALQMELEFTPSGTPDLVSQA